MHLKRQGATLIELVVTMLVLAVISAVTAGGVVYLSRFFLYVPNQLRARAAAEDVARAVLDGEGSKRGVANAVQIVAATPAQLVYVFGYPAAQDQRRMRFRFDPAAGKLYRSYTVYGGASGTGYGPEELLPATGNTITLRGAAASGAFFVYYGQDGARLPATVPAGQLGTIRRVGLQFTANTGGGIFERGDGSCSVMTSVDIKR